MLWGLGIEKVVHHRDDRCHCGSSGNVCCVGQNGQSRCRARLHVAMDLAAPLHPVHFRDMIEPYTSASPWMKKHRRFVGFEFVGAKVVWSQSRRFDVIDKTGNLSGVGLSLLYSGFHRSAFEHFHVPCPAKSRSLP